MVFAPLLGGLLFITALRCEAQGNLVPNPSFEALEDSCPQWCCFNPGQRPLHWYTWQNSSDYFNACALSDWPDSLVDVPQNGWTFQSAFDGDAYAGVYSYQSWDDYREYIGAALLSPLIEGATYQASMRVNTALGGHYFAPTGGSNNIGILFTMAPNAWLGITGPSFGYRNYAHVHATDVIADTAGWTLVSGNFTADSAYQYVVLGNFFENDLTDTLLLLTGASYMQAYYLIDSVSVQLLGHQSIGSERPYDGRGFAVSYGYTSRNATLHWPGRDEFSYELIDMRGAVKKAGSIRGELGVVSLDDLASGLYIATATRGMEVVRSRFVIDR